MQVSVDFRSAHAGDLLRRTPSLAKSAEVFPPALRARSKRGGQGGGFIGEEELRVLRFRSPRGAGYERTGDPSAGPPNWSRRGVKATTVPHKAAPPRARFDQTKGRNAVARRARHLGIAFQRDRHDLLEAYTARLGNGVGIPQARQKCCLLALERTGA